MFKILPIIGSSIVAFLLAGVLASADVPNLDQRLGITGAKSPTGSLAIAIIGIGFDRNHEMLKGKFPEELCYALSDLSRGVEAMCNATHPDKKVSFDTSYCAKGISSCADGTALSIVAAGSHDVAARVELPSGVAPDARIFPVQIFSRFLTKDACKKFAPPCAYSVEIAEMRALEWAEAKALEFKATGKGPQLSAVVLATGAGSFSSTCDNGPVAERIRRLRGEGVPVFVGSGDDGDLNGVGSSGCVSDAVTVGALEPDGSVWQFSNTSTGLVKLMAPGAGFPIYMNKDNIRTLEWFTTTRAAAAAAAGAYILLKASHPDMDSSTILDAMRLGGRPIVDHRTKKPFIAVNVDGSIAYLSRLTDSHAAAGDEQRPSEVPANR